ncbi:PhoU domain-containing protein [Megalodesulfovibrio gigas]|uniref:Phosphate uptake regulator PhoU n=1 Tax=Megalodesulfovibrio gigas (strain ATCC 19364 / DSM 1382 / NCIMB 9332 / VKM B-1759) TaxID=1121448 RepID=T2G6L3_MEGG1|nr:PhoU domain-containing protein [Megalodesulfovibrio gigas]AGW12215.1 hypothetical protein DGI_0285 [Megalodesulfovibrio gigas DSM 1382 = ATCC 19364]
MERILLREGIAENLRFMVLEVTKQVENTKKALDHYDQKIMDSIASRDDYIDNLKSVVENKCFTAIHTQRAQDKRAVDLVRAANTVANNLERVGDFAVSIVGQIKYLKSQSFIQRYDYPRFFREVLDALDMVYQAVVKQDLSLAFKICRAENTLDMLYKVQFDRILYELRSGKETENLITSHLILRYLERMGDAILNIGEAIIFAAVGEKFKIRQYHALKETLALSGIDTPISDVEFHSIWGTRSGCRIGYVPSAAQAPEEGGEGEDASRKKASAGVLFKEGNKKKLLQEMENIMRWESILPGLPPRVLAHQEDATQASLLIEFLGGCNFQDVVLTGDPEVVKNAFFLITETLGNIWDQTLAETQARSHFMEQLRGRLDDVFRLYPSLDTPPMYVGNLEVPTIAALIDEAQAIEETLLAPYTVFIHGDFNCNNIVYDHETQRVHYIDLHRSKQADPLQDISVFLLSNFRLPLFDAHLRARLNSVTMAMYHFAKEYGLKHGDACFEARLAIGLARNFISSTRFELNPKFARELFQRGRYLLMKIAAHKGRPWEEFSLPEQVLVY